jgi:class 3 adenylate cyclase
VTRLTLAVLAISVTSVVIVLALGWQSGQVAINDTIRNTLQTVRATKAAEVESYFATLEVESRSFADSETVIASSQRFAAAFDDLQRGRVEPIAGEVAAFYERELGPKLAQIDTVGVTAGDLVPRDPAALYLQFHYTIEQPATGERVDVVDAGDGSSWSEIHAQFHPGLRESAEGLGYSDVLLINPAGLVIYTMLKELDLGTNLRTGPYSGSGLAAAYSRALGVAPGEVIVVDFSEYLPSLGLPAAFLASPVVVAGDTVAVLAMQLSIGELNRVMTSDGRWGVEGYGATGEAYLVGPDRRLRSDARLFVEDPEAYVERLRADPDVDQADIDAIERAGTTVLLQDADTEAVAAAFAIDDGVIATDNYLGDRVLSAYEPVGIAGLDWVIVTSIGLPEANRPLNDFRRDVLGFVAIFAVVVTFLAAVWASRFIRPVLRIREAAAAVTAGEDVGDVTVESRDEFGELAETFNRMVAQLRVRQGELAEAERARLEVLRGLLPEAVARRVERGDRQVFDTVPMATVVVAIGHGLGELIRERARGDGRAAVARIVEAMDEAAERHGVERIKVTGNAFYGVCGLSTPYLDHAARAVAFAREASEAVAALDVGRDLHFELAVGIHAGPVTAGLVGSRRLIYDMWGDTVTSAFRIARATPAGEVLVSERAAELLPADVPLAFERRTVRGLGDVEVGRLLEQPNHSADGADETPEERAAAVAGPSSGSGAVT